MYVLVIDYMRQKQNGSDRNMIIENPLAWERERKAIQAPLNLNGSEKFWNTVEHHGLKSIRNGTPEFSLIAFPLEIEDAEYEYYFSLETDREVVDYNWEHEKNPKEHSFQTAVLRKRKEEETDEFESIRNENLIPFLQNELNITSPISFETPFSSLTFELNDEIGLQLETNLHTPDIEFHFVSLN